MRVLSVNSRKINAELDDNDRGVSKNVWPKRIRNYAIAMASHVCPSTGMVSARMPPPSVIYSKGGSSKVIPSGLSPAKSSISKTLLAFLCLRWIAKVQVDIHVSVRIECDSRLSAVVCRAFVVSFVVEAATLAVPCVLPSPHRQNFHVSYQEICRSQHLTAQWRQVLLWCFEDLPW